jgi:hypothetical protein
MVCTDNWQETPLPGKRNYLSHLIPIDLAHDTNEEFWTAIVLEKIKAGKDRVKLISTPDTFVRVAIQGVEANREGYGEILESLHQVWSQPGSVRNHGQMKPYLN